MNFTYEQAEFKDHILYKQQDKVTTNGIRIKYLIPAFKPDSACCSKKFSFQDAQIVVESMGGKLYKSEVKDLWRVDFTNMYEDFKTFVIHEIYKNRKNDMVLIPFRTCPNLNKYMGFKLAAELGLNCRILDDRELFWEFKVPANLPEDRYCWQIFG